MSVENTPFANAICHLGLASKPGKSHHIKRHQCPGSSGVEQRIENPRVGGSIPPPGTIKSIVPRQRLQCLQTAKKRGAMGAAILRCSLPSKGDMREVVGRHLSVSNDSSKMKSEPIRFANLLGVYIMGLMRFALMVV